MQSKAWFDEERQQHLIFLLGPPTFLHHSTLRLKLKTFKRFVKLGPGRPCIIGSFQCPFVLFGNIIIIAKIMTTLLGFSSDVEVKGKELITELTWWPPWTVLESFHRFEIIKKEKLFIKLTSYIVT